MTRALDQIVSPHKGNEARALTFGYREDIDWLRAIAVLAVVAFHFEAPAVFGGFVGVDIFFVISGYLITGIILSELKAGNFSFARFYERRVRRLLPALYAMVALTAIPSFHFLLTSERAEFFRSIASVVTFTSNFFFWFQTGYFDHAAVEKPLLHTWSLAVEEQFYLALPITLFLLSRFSRGGRAALPIAFGTLTLASFGLSVWLMRTGGSANAFFMSPPRAWEFLVGGIVALPGFPVLRHAFARRAMRAAAIAMLAIPIFSLRQGPGFPGINALSPCIGQRCSSGAASAYRRACAEAIRRSTSQDSSARFPIRFIYGIGRCLPLSAFPKTAWCWERATRSHFSRSRSRSPGSPGDSSSSRSATARSRRRAAPRSAWPSRAHSFS